MTIKRVNGLPPLNRYRVHNYRDGDSTLNYSHENVGIRIAAGFTVAAFAGFNAGDIDGAKAALRLALDNLERGE